MLQITLHENSLPASRALAPFLGTMVNRETVKLEDACQEIAKLTGIPAIKLEAIYTGAFDEFVEIEKESATLIRFDGGRVEMTITGAMESADSEFDSSKNTLEPALRLDTDTRNHLVNETPTIVTDETSMKVTVSNVADLENPRPYQVIHGQKVAKATGYNLVTTDEGFSCYLMSKSGVKFPCVVDTVISPQEFTFHSEELLEGGDYKFCVESRGGDPEGDLQLAFRKVKYLKIVPAAPRATKMYTPSHEDEGKVAVHASMLYVIGSGLSGLTKDDVTFTLNGEALTIPSSAAWNVTDTQIEIDNGIVDMINGAVDDTIEVTITKSGFDPVTFSTTLVA